MASSSASAGTATSSGVPPGFRFHPTDEELLLYYLKKKVAFEKFELEVIRDVDLNKVEPWDLQERCRIGATPQSEWYFFSHKDRKYPTGSRTNRATSCGFWKATGRDKCIRTTCKQIGMRKTLVFYRGRAPHGQKTDWIMHEYRLDDAGEHQPSERIETEDGWAVCRVFQKKCFIKTSGEATSSQGSGGAPNLVGPTTFDLSRSPSLAVECLNQQHSLHLHHQTYSIAAFYKPELALNYPQLPQSTTNAYPHTQVHTLLHNYRQFSGYHGFSEQLQAVEVGGERDHLTANEWAVMDSLAGRRFAGGGAAAAAVQQMNEAAEPRVGDIGLWGYRKLARVVWLRAIELLQRPHRLASSAFQIARHCGIDVSLLHTLLSAPRSFRLLSNWLHLLFFIRSTRSRLPQHCARLQHPTSSPASPVTADSSLSPSGNLLLLLPVLFLFLLGQGRRVAPCCSGLNLDFDEDPTRRGAGSERRRRASGTSSATKTASIRRGRGRTGRRAAASGRRRGETSAFAQPASRSACGRHSSSTAAELLTARKPTGLCMSTASTTPASTNPPKGSKLRMAGRCAACSRRSASSKPPAKQPQARAAAEPQIWSAPPPSTSPAPPPSRLNALTSSIAYTSTTKLIPSPPSISRSSP